MHNNVYYLDGLPHIGVGHLLTKTELNSNILKIGDEQIKFNLKDAISDDNVLKLLEQDIKLTERLIDRNINVKLNKNQLVALKSYVYNVGYQAFYFRNKGKIDFNRPTKLLKYINQSEFKKAQKEIDINTSNGKVFSGLERRRVEERKIFGEENGI